MHLPITINTKPEAKNIKALYDLCLLYPKHKLNNPINNDKAKNIHSNVSFTIIDKPKIGKTKIINGIAEQWIAHTSELMKPIFSKLFILIVFQLDRKLFEIVLR